MMNKKIRPRNTDRVLEIAKRKGVLRPRDLDTFNIPRNTLSKMYRRGLLERIDRGLYRLPGSDLSEHHTLVEVAKRVPQGVVCLLSALRFHELSTQAPFEVWIAIGEKAWRPKAGNLPLRVVRFSGKALTEGVEEHRIEGVHVGITNPAKTVADCFKYRNKIGLDVALEALRDCRWQRKCTVDDLWHYAKICRVAKVMKPYLEATS
ncbi:MAG TPA: type IV toxin-antitoxin system AbiEi family antitoxin domain-containing protein [Candidatus Heimdallarchaeota archaeon]|nr:type IV toxin-antitoxin system AbiEi family antitoxin domain-containing protein [Candidatus Heimdallarchaeota archaeon]